MPVRSLSSSVLIWPDRDTVVAALRRWAEESVRPQSDVARVGYAGSYSRGDWGVGSDLDVVILLRATDLPFERRSAAWDATALPVPTDVLVYTEAEWDELRAQGRSLTREAIWL